MHASRHAPSRSFGRTAHLCLHWICTALRTSPALDTTLHTSFTAHTAPGSHCTYTHGLIHLSVTLTPGILRFRFVLHTTPRDLCTALRSHWMGPQFWMHCTQVRSAPPAVPASTTRLHTTCCVALQDSFLDYTDFVSLQLHWTDIVILPCLTPLPRFCGHLTGPLSALPLHWNFHLPSRFCASRTTPHCTGYSFPHSRTPLCTGYGSWFTFTCARILPRLHCFALG